MGPGEGDDAPEQVVDVVLLAPGKTVPAGSSVG